MTAPQSTWEVQVVAKGPSGSIIYAEASHSASFFWEFGGGQVVAIIHLTSASEWNEKYPWAADRRDEIVDRIVNDVLRQKCRDCVPSVTEENGKSYVYFRKT